MKGLEGIIGVSVVNPYMGENGWTFEPGPGVIADPVAHAVYLYEVYLQARPNYSGRVTVPVLWDLERNTIVNNEPAEIIRMLNSAFDGVGAGKGDYAPADLIPEINTVNAHVYDTVNNGVYKVGFATTQDAYDQEVHSLFAALDELDSKLGRQPYLLGSISNISNTIITAVTPLLTPTRSFRQALCWICQRRKDELIDQPGLVAGTLARHSFLKKSAGMPLIQELFMRPG